MSKPKPAMNPALFDVRVVQRNVAQGSITAADQKAWNDALPDVASKGQPLHVPPPGTEEEDEESGEG